MADLLNKLNSANYLTVKVTDNAIVNGNNLLAAYALAKTRLPNGIALSISNRLSVILPPANYDLGVQSLTLDTQYIDIIGSTSDRSKHLITSRLGIVNRGTVQQTANDVDLFNLTIENTGTGYVLQNNGTDPAAYFPNTDLPNAYLENINFKVTSTAQSMRLSIKYSGTYINCTAGVYAFSNVCNGTYKNCTVGDYSFGYFGSINSGTFIDCKAGISSFGSSSVQTTGVSRFTTLTNCSAGESSFITVGSSSSLAISGIFTNCTAGGSSFNSLGTGVLNNGTYINCIGGTSLFNISSFGASASSKTVIRNCYFEGNPALQL